MSLEISAEDPQTFEVVADDPPDASCSQSQTVFQCLVKAAANHGIDVSFERLSHSYAIGAGPISKTTVTRIAKEIGLRARMTQIDWPDLLNLGQAYPALANLENGNWVVVLGCGRDEDGAPTVYVFDPLAERSEPLVLGEEKFLRQLARRDPAPKKRQREIGRLAKVRLSMVRTGTASRKANLW